MPYILVTPGKQVKIKVKITLERNVQSPLPGSLDGDRIMTTEGFLALNEVFHQVIRAD